MVFVFVRVYIHIHGNIKKGPVSSLCALVVSSIMVIQGCHSCDV